MSQSFKIFVTIGAIILFLIISCAIIGIGNDSGQKTPYIFVLSTFVALFFLLHAIWKKPKQNDDNDNNSILQK